jgi:hypothetical protein
MSDNELNPEASASDSFEDWFAMMMAGSMGPAPIIDRTEVDNLVVSTIHANEGWYETAILDANGTHPVQRYESVGSAERCQTHP